ncbi:hypothetical protein BD414DRAFT_498104 [Trametes punicea]|nr:hypothetical protein BD414DRAFT_498104 [Trametes punicea]
MLFRVVRLTFFSFLSGVFLPLAVACPSSLIQNPISSAARHPTGFRLRLMYSLLQAGQSPLYVPPTNHHPFPPPDASPRPYHTRSLRPASPIRATEAPTSDRVPVSRDAHGRTVPPPGGTSPSTHDQLLPSSHRTSTSVWQ